MEALEGEAFGRSWGHEDGALMDRTSALEKEHYLVPSIIWGFSKKVSAVKNWPSKDMETTAALILDFPAFKPVNDKAYFI